MFFLSFFIILKEIHYFPLIILTNFTKEISFFYKILLILFVFSIFLSLLFISGNLLCSPASKPFGLCLVNSFLKLLCFESDFFTIISYKLICSPLSLLSKILKENLKEHDIHRINTTFLFEKDGFSFNYFIFLKIITKIVSFFFETNKKNGENSNENSNEILKGNSNENLKGNSIFSKENSKGNTIENAENSKVLSSLLESYFKLYYHLYLFSDKIDLSNIKEFHEAFIEKFMQENNRIFFKFAIKETLQILMKLLQEIGDISNEIKEEIEIEQKIKGKIENAEKNEEKSRNLINILLCLNFLLQKQAICYENLQKKLHLSLYIIEIIEFILMDLSKKNIGNYEEIAIIMRKFYLMNFQNLLHIETVVFNDNSGILLINILENMLNLISEEYPRISPIYQSKKLIKTFKYVNLSLNIIAKLLSLYIERIFMQKSGNFPEEFLSNSFNIFQRCVFLCENQMKFLHLLFSENSDIPLKYDIFFTKYLDPNSEFYTAFSKGILNNSSNNIRMFLKTFITISDILNYFNFPRISIFSSQITLLIISTGRNLEFLEKDDKNEKNLLNLLLQARISFVLQRLYEDYKQISAFQCMKEIDDNLQKNFLSCFQENKAYFRLFKHKKEFHDICNDLKENMTVIHCKNRLNQIKADNSKDLATIISELMNLLRKIAKKYEKRKTLCFLSLKSEILLVLCKFLHFYGLNSLAFSLLNDYNFIELLSFICKFDQKQLINHENLQKSCFSSLASKGIKDFLSYTKSRISELKHGIFIKENKGHFIVKIIEKGIVFNEFWKINRNLSKSFKFIVEILNKNVGIYSYSKYYEKLFIGFELKSLRIVEYFKLLNNSQHILKENREENQENGVNEENRDKIFDFTAIFDQIFIFSQKKRDFTDEIYRLFFPKRKSLSSRITLSELMIKISHIFEGNSHKKLIKEIIELFLSIFHESFSSFNNTKDLDLLLIKNLLSDAYSYKSDKNTRTFSIFLQESQRKNCEIFGNFLIKNSENAIISKNCFENTHNIYKFKKNIMENDFIMFFLNGLMKKNGEIPDKITNGKITDKNSFIKRINMRNSLIILINETTKYDISLAYHYLYLLYQYEAGLYHDFLLLIKENKAEFIVLLQNLFNSRAFTCLCDKIKEKSNEKSFKKAVFFSMKDEILLLLKFFNKPYDFKLFLKEYDLKNKVLSSKVEETKNLRKSLKNLHIFNKEDPKVIKGIKIGLGINIPNNMNCTYIDNLIKRNLKGKSIIFIKYLEENNEKLMIIGKINMDKKEFLTFKIDSQHKMNFLKDFLYDFRQTIKGNEKSLKESSKNSNVNKKEWWEIR